MCFSYNKALPVLILLLCPLLSLDNNLYAKGIDPYQGVPLLHNYSVPTTRHNGEVWSFRNADAGQLWIGSDELYLFDGNKLEKVDLPFETYAVRALEYDDNGTLWVGMTNNLGTVAQTSNGTWQFTSVLPLLKPLGLGSLRVWDAYNTPYGMVFICDHHILRYANNTFSAWKIAGQLLLRSTYDGKNVWIFDDKNTLYKLEEDGPILSLPAEKLPNSPHILWAVESGDTFIVGGSEGVFKKTDDSWIKLEPVSSLIKEKASWKTVLMDSNSIAIGTALDGVYIIDFDGNILRKIDKNNGLPNHSTSALWLDRSNGKLWIGYVGGMASLDIREYASVFDSRNGLSDIPILKTLQHKKNTYIVSRQSVSLITKGCCVAEPAQIKKIVQLHSPIADTIQTDKSVWVCGAGGDLWEINNGNAVFVKKPTGLIYCLTLPLSDDYELLYFEENRLKALQKAEDGNWKTLDMNILVDGIPNLAARGKNGDLWVSTITNGIYRLKTKESKTSPEYEILANFRPGYELPTDIPKLSIARIGDAIVAFSGKVILHYNSHRNEFVPVESLIDYGSIAVTQSNPNESAYCIVNNKWNNKTKAQPVLIKLKYDHDSDAITWEPLDAPGLEALGSITNLDYSSVDGKKILWIAGTNALLRLVINEIKAPPPPPDLLLKGIHVNNHLVEVPSKNNILSLDSGTKTLQFQFHGLNRISNHNLFLRYRLSGFSDEWSKPMSESSIQFTGLKSGTYNLQAQTFDTFGQTGNLYNLKLRIAPPFYLHPLAFVFYLLILLSITYAIIKWRSYHLKQLNRRLNRLVDDRTMELARANRTSSEFLEVISHEIRNPLNGIANLVDLLHDTKLDPQAQRLAASLLRSTEQLKQVFNDILGYTKLEYGHVRINVKPFSVRQMLEDLMALYELKSKEQNIQMSISLGENSDALFLGDVDKIRSIVKNFLSNAIKYGANGKIDIYTHCIQNTSEEELYELTIGIKDDGPGIPANEKKNIFKKFYRGERSKKFNSTGTGLGLYICSILVELLNGKIDVISEEGKGSDFRLALNLEKTHRSTTSKTSLADYEVSLPAVKNVLIVDDQEYNQEVLRGISMRLNFEPFIASSSDDVWPIVNKNPIFLIFLDWELPGLNGGEIAKRLRQHPNTSHSIIIATTAHENDDIRQKCLESGMDGFALKPFDTSKIKYIVEKAWYQNSGRKDAPKPQSAPPPAPSIGSTKVTLTAFEDFSFANPDKAKNAVQLYLDTLDEEISHLKAAAKDKDPDIIAKIAHRLRSHSGLVNGVDLNLAAKDLMLSARERTNKDWKKELSIVYSEAHKLKKTIKDLSQKKG